MKSFKVLSIGLVLGVLVLSAFTSGVDDFIANLKGQLKAYLLSHPGEKVYLHFDKTFYKPGDEIWFNAFVVDAGTNKPTTISDVLHVDLKDPKGNTTLTLTLFVQEGTSRGNFHIGESMPGGLYNVVAYTRWMQNEGDSTFFRKELQVQKVITPRMLLKVDFEKESYGKGEEVRASLTAKDLRNEGLNSAAVESVISIAGNVIARKNHFTDSVGKLDVTFKLPDSLSTTDGILQLIISTSGRQESITRSVPIVLNKITMQFFPEGGELIAGAMCNVAFEALNEFGKGADVSGIIVDETNSVLSKFSSFHMGMGSFKLTPQEGHTYRARIDTPFVVENSFELPKTQRSGFVMTKKEQSAGSLVYSVYSNHETIGFLVGQSHGIIYYADKIKLTHGLNDVSVSTEAFPAGVAVFTLFNSEGLEEAERLIFLNSEKVMNVDIKTDKQKYAPGEKVEVSIQTTDNKGKPVPAKLSLSVVDDQVLSFADDKQDNILSWILLSSELKGNVQEPSFYFDKNKEKATAALDYLLLTRGWRRFCWKDIVANDRNVSWLPENFSSVSGLVVSQKGGNTQAEAILMELGNRRRIAKVESMENGQFYFRNADASVPLLVLTRKPNRLEVSDKLEALNVEGSKAIAGNKDKSVPTIVMEPSNNDFAETKSVGEGIGLLNFSLDEDVKQLSEVVVVGYGAEEKRDLTGSVTTVVSPTFGLDAISAYASPEGLLQGRVAGVQITQQSGGITPIMSLRGINSFRSGRNEPLYLIDGVPINNSGTATFSNGSVIGSEAISSIEVLQSPEASAIYGSAAANGAILISTRSAIQRNGGYRQGSQRSKYSTVLIQPRTFSTTKEFFRETSGKNVSDGRTNFESTAYWNSTVRTGEDGKAKLTFNNNESTTSFRITAEGITSNGLIGRNEQTYATEIPFSLDAKFPMYLGYEDTLRLAVKVTNNSDQPLSGKLGVHLPEALKSLSNPVTSVMVDANKTETYWIGLASNHVTGDFPIVLSLDGEKYADEVKHTISVHPVGFPVRISFSGKDPERSIQFKINQAEKGSLHGEITAFPEILSDLFSGAEGILREPHGCFEQVSSSTFPNILALQYLRESGQLNAAAQVRAQKYIQTGYKLLTSYEINSGGFEWFGHPPAHEALTAYGLIEFTEMKKVFDHVDDAMITRTRNWLLSRRVGDGTFKLHMKGMDGFYGANEAVYNAYLVYALAASGTTDILPEYRHSLKDAWDSQDMYRLALMANAAHHLGQTKDYVALTEYFALQEKSIGLAQLKSELSVVSSYGFSLNVETVSLWCTALLKSPQRNMVIIDRCIHYITSGRAHGTFGSTQATILALKSLTEYAMLVRGGRDDGELLVTTNDTATDAKPYTKETKEKIVAVNFKSHLVEGTNTIGLKFRKTNSALPYSIDISWYTKLPSQDSSSYVRIESKLAQSRIRINETVRLVTTLRNIKHEPLPMTMAVIGIPAGLTTQPWQLKELQEKGVFDYYEIIGDKLALYYRAFKSGAIQTVNLDLKAEISGTFTGPASCAYLYYTDEHKDWTAGNSIVITQ